MDRRLVYMDYNATTPLRPEVRAAMAADLDVYANASSMHEAGRRALERIQRSRASVAALIGARPDEIVFTSGGSESNNTVFATMLGLGKADPGRRKIVTTAIEHPCVMRSAERLRDEGFPVAFVGVDSDGRLDLESLERELDPSRSEGGPVLLVSVMAANNEIGTLQDIPRIAAMAKAAGAFMHSDAVQAAGKIPVDVGEWKVDYLTLSCHKIYGPKGVGALYIRRGSPLDPLIRGGHQEDGLRAGTYNNQGILGFGLAAELARAELPKYAERVGALRERLRAGLLASVPSIRINGHRTEVLPNTLNVSFPGAEGESILLSLDLEGIEVSTGSACASGSLDPSHVLVATGVGPELSHGSIRFSLGRDSTEAEIDYVLEKLPPIIERLRRMSTLSAACLEA